MYQTPNEILQLGIAAHRLSQWQRAHDYYKQGLDSDPIEARFLLGHLAYDRGDISQAKVYFLTVLNHSDQHRETRLMLGNVAIQEKDYQAAKAILEQLRVDFPDYLGVCLSLGEVYLELIEPLAALNVLSHYILAHSEDIHGWFQLAHAYASLQWTFHAARCLERVLEIEPTNSMALTKLHFYWTYMGQNDALRTYFERVLQLNSGGQTWFAALPEKVRLEYLSCHTNLVAQYLLYSYADPQVSDRVLFGRIWDYLESTGQNTAPKISPSDQRPIRVAYLSREFHFGSSMSVLSLLFYNHSDQFEIYAYDDTPQVTDFTEHMSPRFQAWRRIYGKNNQEVAKFLIEDQIQILVDLGGLVHSQRRDLYALKICPVQISGLGFLFTSTYSGLDYCFTDRLMCPPEIALLYPEKPVYLETYFHWSPPENLPEPRMLLPCEEQGCLTFGSANTLNKQSPELMKLWIEIILKIPDSRLYLKALAFNDPSTCEMYRQLFEALGFPLDRLKFDGAVPGEDHIPYFYSQVDIALDSFPYQGGITTVESLWMGVPVVVLNDSRYTSRALGASILHSLDLGDWLADSQEVYVQRALAWSRDLAFLRHCRKTLRSRLKESRICDGIRYAQEVEQAYLDLVKPLF